jgi:hypothetical protein
MVIARLSFAFSSTTKTKNKPIGGEHQWPQRKKRKRKQARRSSPVNQPGWKIRAVRADPPP